MESVYGKEGVWEEGRVNRWNTGYFLGSETILCGALMVETFPYVCVHNQITYSTKGELYCG